MPARQTAAHQAESASCKVGYRNPPRHTQFRKGQSGNPGGRPRRDEAERLKAITLKEAYRAVAIRENGILAPVTAIQAVMRRQVELAMEGNVHAQRDLLRAVRTYERADVEEEARKEAALEAALEKLAQELVRLAEGLEAARAEQTPEKQMSCIEAARRITHLLRAAVAEQETAAEPEEQEDGGEEAEMAAEETDTDWNAAAPPPADGVPQPENGTAPAVAPFVSQPASQPAAEPPADPRPRPPRRRASNGTPEPAPSGDVDAAPHGITCDVIASERACEEIPHLSTGLPLPPWGGASRVDDWRFISESSQVWLGKKSRRICNFAPVVRPPHPDPLPPRGEGGRAAASGKSSLHAVRG